MFRQDGRQEETSQGNWTNRRRKFQQEKFRSKSEIGKDWDRKSGKASGSPLLEIFETRLNVSVPLSAQPCKKKLSKRMPQEN